MGTSRWSPPWCPLATHNFEKLWSLWKHGNPGNGRGMRCVAIWIVCVAVKFSSCFRRPILSRVAFIVRVRYRRRRPHQQQDHERLGDFQRRISHKPIAAVDFFFPIVPRQTETKRFSYPSRNTPSPTALLAPSTLPVGALARLMARIILLRS